MPATINTAATPVAAASSPVARKTGDSTAGNEANDRSFASVLKKQSSASAPASSKSDSKSADTSRSSETEPATAATTNDGIAVQWVQSEAQTATAAADADLTNLGTQAESVENTLIPLANLSVNGADPTVARETAVRSTRPSSLIAAGMNTIPASALENSDTTTTDDPVNQFVSDIRDAISRTKSSAASTSAANASPAINAASLEEIASESGGRARQTLISASNEQLGSLVQSGSAGTTTISLQTVSSPPLVGRGEELRIGAPVGTDHWDTAVGNSLVVMSSRLDGRAELVLTPPQLGRIEVSLSVKGDDASVSFISASPVVREALENAMPRLREILADAGITLGQTQVGSESPGQSAKDSQNRDNPFSAASTGTAVGETSQLELTAQREAVLRRVALSLVDTYA